MELKEKLRILKQIKEIEAVRGRHTELVSVYIPAGYDIVKIIQHLQQEQGTASNIKDAKTRNNVIDSLEKMIRHLRLYDKTPKNGLAVFSGNASDNESKIDIKVWSIEPPEELNQKVYRCDQSFLVDPLRAMLDHSEAYGLIVLDRREGDIGLLKGTSVTHIDRKTSDVPGKTKAGGQSAQRFHRIREGAAKEFYKRVAESAKQAFYNMKELKGIIIGGPSPTKEEFFHGDYLNDQLKRKVLGLKDLSYTGKFGMDELVEKSGDLLREQEMVSEKQLVGRFLEMLAKEPEKIAYGKAEVEKALEMNAVDTLLISSDIDEEEIEDWEIKASEGGAQIHLISTETNEGNQLKNLGKIGAILRFAI